MFRQSTATLLFFFVLFQVAAQVGTISSASSANTENFYWKSSYSRGAGSNPATTSTASCAGGLERGAVLSAPFAIHGAKPGAYLCYAVCKAGYKGTGPVCWQSPAPVGYVDCGPGIAVSSNVCGLIVTNQFVSISAFSFAATALGTTDSSTGEEAADVLSMSKSEIKAAMKSPKLYEDAKDFAEELLPLAKANEALVKSELKSVAAGAEDAPTMAKELQAAMKAGLSDPKIVAGALKFKKALLGLKVTIRAGSIVYDAVYDIDQTPLDYVRDTAGLASYAFGMYEITHPEDKVPAATIFATVAAFLYPEYGVSY